MRAQEVSVYTGLLKQNILRVFDLDEKYKASSNLWSAQGWRIGLTYNKNCWEEFQCVHFREWDWSAEITFYHCIVAVNELTYLKY